MAIKYLSEIFKFFSVKQVGSPIHCHPFLGRMVSQQVCGEVCADLACCISSWITLPLSGVESSSPNSSRLALIK